VVSILNASNLDRNLYLTTQALELGVPVVVALNMIDIAEQQGLRIDHEQLGRLMGVPVVPIVASQRKGLDALQKAIAAAARQHPVACCPASRHRQVPEQAPSENGAAVFPSRPHFPDAFENEVRQLRQLVGPELPEYLVRRLLLDAGGYTEQRLGQRFPQLGEQIEQARLRLAAAGHAIATLEARTRYGWIRQLTQRCVQRPKQRPITWTDRIDRVLTHWIWGTLIFLVIMFGVFQAIFTGAQPLMDLIKAGKDMLGAGLRAILPPGPLTSLLTEGVLEGVGGILVFLPQILILFGFIAVLEDCGYMARAAFLMDRLMSRCGLSGKSFIPLLSSLACAVPGIMATRVIENRRDRLTTILVAPLMSCSARLPVYTLLIGAFLTVGYPWWMPGLMMFAMYAIGLVLAPLMALLLKRTLLRGEAPVFLMEMPLYKRPSLRTVLGRMFDASWAFVRRAGTIILWTMVLVWAMLYYPSGDGQGSTYPEQIRQLQEQKAQAGPEESERLVEQIHAKELAWKRQSLLGRLGRFIEPAVRPLGWDWRIGVATLASFPAREVVVGTLGIVYQVGKVESGDLTLQNAAEHELSRRLKLVSWEGSNQPVFTVPTALSVMVFFALCCQCASTLAVIQRETNSWRWPLFTFTYMTVLAYLGALVVYQVGRLLG
jgi:ferrous iron transport protein B